MNAAPADSIHPTADLKKIRHFIAGQTRRYWIISIGTLILFVLLWIWLAGRILDFGRKLDWSFLTSISPQLADFTASINPYLWWAIVLLMSLGVYVLVSALLTSTYKKTGDLYPSNEELLPLMRQLSVPTLSVLAWVWHDHSEPIAVQDLRSTCAELKNDRHYCIEQSREQLNVLREMTRSEALSHPRPDPSIRS